MAVSLTGCATEDTDSSLLPCPPLIAYDEGFRNAAADAVLALSPQNPVILLLEDYEALRAYTRSCIQHL